MDHSLTNPCKIEFHSYYLDFHCLYLVNVGYDPDPIPRHYVVKVGSGQLFMEEPGITKVLRPQCILLRFVLQPLSVIAPLSSQA